MPSSYAAPLDYGVNIRFEKVSEINKAAFAYMTAAARE
jgi:hypothetical protein